MSAAVGLLLGMRHALEPDHLAAVSTLAAERSSARRGWWLGVAWGVGHTLSLVLVAAPLALLEAAVPERLMAMLELGVAVMVVGLGLRAVWRARVEARGGPVSTHQHGEVTHTHEVAAAHVHVSQWTLATRPLLVGLAHGLAGSGALTALVLVEQPTTAARLAYITVFGIGSVVGMGLLTGVLGAAAARVVTSRRVAAGVLGVAGAASLLVGCWWAVSAAGQLI